MRALLQRVTAGQVSVEQEVIAEIGLGLLALVGVFGYDRKTDAEALAEKISVLRVFADERDRMNRSIQDVGGSVLVVSQFTLAASVRKGRRPSFTDAADPAVAQPILTHLISHLSSLGVDTHTGNFGAKMAVEIINDGPVTVLIDTFGGKVVDLKPST